MNLLEYCGIAWLMDLRGAGNIVRIALHGLLHGLVSRLLASFTSSSSYTTPKQLRTTSSLIA